MKQIILILLIALLAISSVSAKNIELDDLKSNKIVTIATGKVVNENNHPIADVPVNVYCNHSGNVFVLDEVTTKVNGRFRAKMINFPWKKCIKNDKVWAIVDYGEHSYYSDVVKVKKRKHKYVARLHTISVPEFTPVTIGVAVSATLLGLLIIRKND